MDSSGNSLLGQLLIIFILTLINAFFASAELAFVSVNQSKMRGLAEEGNKKALRVLDLLEKSDDFLSTIQVAITLAGFLSSASASASFASLIADWLPTFPGAEQAAIIIVTLILSYVTLVFGELYPKQLALQMPDEIAMATSGVIKIVQKLFRPFVKLLSFSIGLLKKITPIDFTAREESFTRDEMKVLLAETRKSGAIDVAEFSMLQGVLSLDSKLAREVMVPRTDTQMVDIEDNYDEIMHELLTSPFSRIPIYREDKDNVISVIHVKSLLKAAREEGFENIDLLSISSEPLFVPSTIYIDDLLVEFKREQTHMAILRDEYGGVEGIVTLEDLIEEIVGDIEDETDVNSSSSVRKIDDNNYYIKGGTPIDKFNQYFQLDLESDEVDTMAGLIIEHIGYMPDDDEKVSVRAQEYVLTTSHVENGRIRGIHVAHDEERALHTEFDFSDEDMSMYDQLNLIEDEED
ncbi:hemolysin family protein [Fundicoccus sp. Sow4_D5]|uniref:hemolysin family protein n=1 Tax=unclassified Fundicoccus TaxID=2761543 RepID=UPI003F927042